MIIKLHKPKAGAKGGHTLVCERADGSTTMSPTRVGADHDLAHLAVETTLGLTESFFALVAGGIDLQIFSRPASMRGVDIPLEADQTEFIVGLLQLERMMGCQDDFNGEVARMCRNKDIDPPPAISDDDLTTIREMFAELTASYRALSPGETLELEFEG